MRCGMHAPLDAIKGRFAGRLTRSQYKAHTHRNHPSIRARTLTRLYISLLCTISRERMGRCAMGVRHAIVPKTHPAIAPRRT